MNWIMTGALSALVSVAAGAFGAHALKERLSDNLLNAFEVGVRYQMYHALALILMGLLMSKIPAANTAAWCFLVGTFLFSGSLYGLALTGLKFLGPITPIGGVVLMAGWVVLAWSSYGQA
ncbi:MAG TPA: DUF423 domain-containing protein [Myxococcales bacterium]|nr:DUF423 domain-containing protein [Myxococcales bacterium]HIN84895.1 DUF423 domain-containing protein [Myxococcales bacterium]